MLGDYATAGDALAALEDTHPLGTYLMQRVSPGDKGTVVSLSSPVVASFSFRVPSQADIDLVAEDSGAGGSQPQE